MVKIIKKKGSKLFKSKSQIDLYRGYGIKLKKYLTLETLPLGIQLLKEIEQVPEYSKRPKKDLGYHLSLCQAMAISRRNSESFSMFKEDMWCFEPVIGLGFEKAPKYFLDGNNRYPGTARTIEAGKNWAKNFPHFEYGKYHGIAFSPLKTINFKPDMMLLYCNPAQITQIMIAVNWIDGNDVLCRVSGHAGCVYAIVPTLQNKQFQITVPCLGDRKRAMAQNYEIIFSFPTELANDLIMALENLEKSGSGLPVDFQQFPEYNLEDSYKKIGKIIGMDIN